MWCFGDAPAVRVPIQVITPTFGGQSVSSNPCNDTVDSDPDAASLNGILGIGLFRQDCGSVCAVNSNNTLYFSCQAASCAGAVVSVVDQVQNPVWLLPSGNNGVVITLPNVPESGRRRSQARSSSASIRRRALRRRLPSSRRMRTGLSRPSTREELLRKA
jgi:hypothetical protein